MLIGWNVCFCQKRTLAAKARPRSEVRPTDANDFGFAIGYMENFTPALYFVRQTI
jgi:hypothetical protein